MREAFLSETPPALLQQRVDAIRTTDRKQETAHKQWASGWQGALAAAVVVLALLGAALTGLGLYPPERLRPAS